MRGGKDKDATTAGHPIDRKVSRHHGSTDEIVEHDAQGARLAGEEFGVTAPRTGDVGEPFGLKFEHGGHESASSSDFADATAIMPALDARVGVPAYDGKGTVGQGLLRLCSVLGTGIYGPALFDLCSGDLGGTTAVGASTIAPRYRGFANRAGPVVGRHGVNVLSGAKQWANSLSESRTDRKKLRISIHRSILCRQFAHVEPGFR